MTLNNFLRLTTVAIGISIGATAQTPFVPGNSIAIAKPGMNAAAKVYTIYTNTTASSSSFAAGTTFTSAYNINGIGLNAVDNFVYGAAFTGNSNNLGTAFNISLFRIGADGTTVDLGLLPLTGAGGSGTMEFVNFSAGAVSVDGTYYYMTYSINATAAARILSRVAMSLAPDLTSADLRMFVCWKSNVSALVGGGSLGSVSGYYEIDYSNTDITAGVNAFLNQVNNSYPNVFDADGGIQDFAISPVDNKLYGYISYPSGATTVGRPVVLSAPAAGISVASPVGTVVNSAPGQEATGVQFDQAGNFYTLFTTGDYAQVNMTTGALIGLAPSNLATAGGNLRGDLASTLNITPLSMELTSFSGKRNGAVNELNWITASEQNNKSFTIEKSADQSTWTAAGTVASKSINGNSSTKLSYSFTDNAPLSGKTFYRLKQMDYDGKVNYSGIISMTTENTNNISIYPNPATESIRINGLTAGNTIRVADIAGKTIQTLQVSSNSTLIDLSTLARNIYIIQVVDDGSLVYSGKVIKK